MIDRRALRMSLASGALLALPAIAFAAEHEEGPANPMSFQAAPFLATLITFGVAVFVLGKYVWPKILKGLQDREHKISSEIASAEEARKQASDALKQYEKSLQEARAEATSMLERTKAEQQKMAAELKAKADVELAAMRDRATRDIEAAKREAISEIYNQAAGLAADLAAKVLKREINAGDHKRLIEESLGELEAAGRR